MVDTQASIRISNALSALARHMSSTDVHDYIAGSQLITNLSLALGATNAIDEIAHSALFTALQDAIRNSTHKHKGSICRDIINTLGTHVDKLSSQARQALEDHRSGQSAAIGFGREAVRSPIAWQKASQIQGLAKA